MTATAYLVGLLDTANLTTPIVFDVFSEENPTVEGVRHRRCFVVASATGDDYAAALDNLATLHPWSVALAPRAIRMPEGANLAAGYHAAGLAMKSAGFTAGTLVARIHRVLKLVDELRAERDEARTRLDERGTDVVEAHDDAIDALAILRRVATSAGLPSVTGDIPLTEVPNLVDATLSSLSVQLDEAHRDTAATLLRVADLEAAAIRDDVEHAALMGRERELQEQVATLTDEKFVALGRLAGEMQEAREWREQCEIARADVATLTAERDHLSRGGCPNTTTQDGKGSTCSLLRGHAGGPTGGGGIDHAHRRRG